MTQHTDSSPVKDRLFEYIDSSEKISKLAREKKFDEIISSVTDSIYDEIITMEQSVEQAVGTLATGLLHYLLTTALITSQRKIKYDQIELDIVIPDTKTLQKDPKKTLIILISKSSDINQINQKIAALEKVQPEKENVWVVLSKNIQIKDNKRTFVLDKKDNTFAKIIFEIGKFTNVGGTNNLKILRI